MGGGGGGGGGVKYVLWSIIIIYMVITFGRLGRNRISDMDC